MIPAYRRCALAAPLLAALFVVLAWPALPTARAEMSYQERLDMKRRVQRQVERGQVPQATRDMPYEQRLYIKRKQQALERERLQAPPPAPIGRRTPDGGLYPADRGDRGPYPPRPGYGYRPGPRGYDRYPSHYRSYRSYPRSYYYGPAYRSWYGPSWRHDRCWSLWGGYGPAYWRCVDGYHEYLYPAPGFTGTVVVEPPPVVVAPAPVPVPAPPVAVESAPPAGPSSLTAEPYPVWFAPQVSAPGVVSVEDPDRNRRAFHLVGVRSTKQTRALDDCIGRYLTRAQVRVNEVIPASRYRGADAEAVVFVDDLVLNLEVLTEGCAEFDATTCAESGFDGCTELANAETVARINRVGIWRE
jgi:hypothetical protein